LRFALSRREITIIRVFGGDLTVRSDERGKAVWSSIPFANWPVGSLFRTGKNLTEI